MVILSHKLTNHLERNLLNTEMVNNLSFYFITGAKS